MSSKKNGDLATFFQNVGKGLSKYSIQELNDAIVRLLESKQDRTAEISIALKLVTKHFSIPMASLMDKHPRGKTRDAKDIAYCLLHFDLDLKIRYISKEVFENWPSSVSNGIQRYKKLNMNFKPDREFMESYTQLKRKLVEILIQGVKEKEYV